MEKIPPMVDMALDPSENKDCELPVAACMPKYPWGLTISLCEKEIEKLGLDFESMCIDDILHFHCLAVVVSKSSNEHQDGDPHYSMSLQITHLSGESEDDENAQAEGVGNKAFKKLYKQ